MDTSELIKLWRVEKRNNTLGALPDGFYDDMLGSIRDIANPYEKKKMEEVFQELLFVRQHKMLMAVLRQLQGEDRPKDLCRTERGAYDKILAALMGMTSSEAPGASIEVQEVREVQEEAGSGEVPNDQKTLGDIDAGAEEVKEEEAGEKTEEKPEKPEETPGEAEEPGEAETLGEPPEDAEEEPGASEAREVGGEEKQVPGAAEAGEAVEEHEPAVEETPEETAKEPESPHEETPKEAGAEAPKAEEEPEGEEPKEAHKPEDEVFKEDSENKGDLTRVKFLKSLPAFVGQDLKTIGPFEEGEEIEVPRDVAEILIKNDAAEEM